MELIGREDYLALELRARCLLVQLTFWGEMPEVEKLAHILGGVLGGRVGKSWVSQTLRAFVHRGWFSPLSERSNENYFVWIRPVSRAAYEEMLREAGERNWWPGAELVGDPGLRDLFPELHRAPTPGSKPRPNREMFIAEGLRLLAAGSGAAATPEFRAAMQNAKAVDLAQAIAYFAMQRLGEEPVFNLVADDPLLPLLPCVFNTAFFKGRSALGLRDAVRRLHEAKVQLPAPLSEVYWAVCAWTNDRTGLDGWKRRKDNVILRGCQALCAGDRVEADGFFKTFEQNNRYEGLLSYGNSHRFDLLPLRVLIAMVNAVAKPGKVGKQLPARILDHQGQSYSRYESRTPDSCYRDLFSRVGNWAGIVWKDITSGRDSYLDKARTPRDFDLLEALIYAWDYRLRSTGRTAFADVAARLWQAAHVFAANGWTTAARLLSSLLVGGYDAGADAAFLSDLDARGAFLLPRELPPSDWDGVRATLEKVLAKALPKKARGEGGEKPAKDRIFWGVELDDGPVKDILRLANITAVFRPAGAPDDGSDDMLLDRHDLSRQSNRAKMDERDLAILTLVLGSYYGVRPTEGEFLRRLCGMKNVIRYRSIQSGWRVRLENPRPAEFVLRKCEMTSTVAEDGGIVLTVPEWVLGNEGNYVLRREATDRYGVYETTPEVRKVLAAITGLGTGGKIEIPREAVAQAEPLIEGLAKLMPLAEPSADETERLPRVSASSDVRLRLDYGDGVFSARAVVLPLAENPNLALDPGVGAAEKIVAGARSFLLVRDLAAEQAAFAPVKEALREHEGAFDGRSAWRFDDIEEGLSALAAIKTLEGRVPAEWMDNRRLSLSYAPKSGVKLSSTRTAEDWFHVEGEFRLDDGRVMGIVTILEAARSRVGRYVRLKDGDYVALSDKMARELDALAAAGRRKGDGVEVVKAAVPMLDGAFGDGEDALELPDAMAATAEEIRAAFAKRPTPPRTLNAELRPYQVDGYRWLSRLAACGFGACLADDMGLGKTIQVISLLLERRQGGPSLVFAPSSVCGNWRREIERFAPTLRVVMALEEEIPLDATKAGDVVVASYGYLLFHVDAFRSVTWNGLVLDEAQAIKNDASKRAKAVKGLHAKFRVAATGTPVENRLGELWSLFDFLNPGLLGPAASFAQRFTADGRALPALKRLVKPLILRRLKGDVLDDLPEKTEVTIPVVLGEAERTAYEGCRRYALAQLAEKGEEEGGANRMSILAELTRLRRFCCHPSLVLPGAGVPSAKMEALVELLENLYEGHHRALVFSQFTDYLALVRKMVESHGWSHLYLDGSTPTLERERLVNAFQGGEGDFFLISLKAGGTGLNLTAANYVILLDPWWNPAVENQAADRAHRIGQKNPVTVYRLIAGDTVEARVVELHHEKLTIAEDVLDGTASTALSPAQLMKLFA